LRIGTSGASNLHGISKAFDKVRDFSDF
jgi:hypothetical protein